MTSKFALTSVYWITFKCTSR